MLIHLLIPVLYSIPFFFFIPDKIHFVEFVCGVFIGFSLFFVDRFLHVFFVDPQAQLSRLVRKEWKEKRFINAIKAVIQGRALQEKLITRSILFLIIYVALTLFVLTSTTSFLGIGMVLGIGLHFCLDLVRYSSNTLSFQKHFLWQIKRRFSQQEIHILVAIFCLFFTLLTLLVAR